MPHSILSHWVMLFLIKLHTSDLVWLILASRDPSSTLVMMSVDLSHHLLTSLHIVSLILVNVLKTLSCG